jgi:hypothetical protein
MKTLTVLVGVTTVLLAIPHALQAQSKTVPGETKTLTVSVESIESSNREVTVKKPDGTYDVFYVPSGIKRFDALKVGDKVTARYYENVVITLKRAGEAAKNSSNAATTRSQEGTAGTSARQRTITATITAVDMNVPSITFTGPNNWVYSTRVQDKEALAKVKAGDRVDITWTEAMILSLDQAK